MNGIGDFSDAIAAAAEECDASVAAAQPGQMVLRDYQQRAVEEIASCLESASSTLLVMATGTGKTQVFLQAMMPFLAAGRRVLILAHREELIFQPANRCLQMHGFYPSIEMGEFRSDSDWRQAEIMPYARADKRVVVGTVQSMRTRLDRFNPGEFGLVIVDEAHHATAPSYRVVLDHFTKNESIKVLGVTATPDRQDEAALGQVFETVAFEYGFMDAVNDGYLVPVEQQYIVVESLDFSGIRTVAGDFNQADLDAVMREEEAVHRLVAPTIEMAPDEPTIVFAVSVSHAERIAEVFNRHEPGSAVCVTGSTSRQVRRDEFARFVAGQRKRLVNCMVATEGTDLPNASVIVMGRPTKSRALFSQMIGRGLRPLPGVVDGLDSAAVRCEAISLSPKPRCLVLDFVGNSGRHKLIHAADVLGGNYDDAVVELAKQRMTEAARNGTGPRNVQDELEAAARDLREREQAIARARQEAIRKHVVAGAKYTASAISAFDVLNIAPPREPGYMRGKMATPRQIEFLQRAGVDIPESCTQHQASALITTIKARRDAGLCTYKQAKLLQKFGEDSDVPFEVAKQVIDEIARNGWRPRR